MVVHAYIHTYNPHLVYLGLKVARCGFLLTDLTDHGDKLIETDGSTNMKNAFQTFILKP